MDEVVPFRQGRKIHQALPCPNELLEIEGASHNNIAEVGGRLYDESIYKFLKNLLND